MADQFIKEKYYSLLLQYINRQEELPLAEAYELGRKLMISNSSVEDVAAIHESALLRLGDEFPAMTLKQTANLILTPLREMLMSFSMLFREQRERERAEEALANALKELKNFMDAIPDIAYIIKSDLSLANWNRAAEDILGYSSEEINGINVLEFIAKEDHEKVAKTIQEI